MKHLYSVVLLLFMSIVSRSQTENDEMLVKELGISLGTMNCNTDIGGKIADPKSFKLSGGIYFSALYNQMVGLRLEATTGAVTASDARATAVKLGKRNLDFTSSISELSLLAEVHPLNILFNTGTTPALSPYLLGGVGYFAFNPKTQLNGNWVYLQPLHTEGEGFPETGRSNYKTAAFNFPVGGGLQLNISDRFTLRGEAVYRLLNTDYLDDVSTTYIDPDLFDKYLPQYDATLAKRLADRSYIIPEDGARPPGAIRGNSAKEDAYYSINIKLGIKLFGGGSSLYKTGAKKHSGCYSLR